MKPHILHKSKTKSKHCKGCSSLRRCAYTYYNKPGDYLCPCSNCIIKLSCQQACAIFERWWSTVFLSSDIMLKENPIDVKYGTIK